MKKNLFIIYALLLIIVSCAPKKGIVSTKLKLFSGNIFTGVPLNGGVLVVARNDSHTSELSFVLNSSAEDKVIELSKGRWEFVVVAWTGVSGNFTGINKCDHVDFVDLNQAEQTIAFNLTSLKCAQSIISDNAFIDTATGIFQPFKIDVCNASSLSSTNCPATTFNTTYKSYRVNLNANLSSPISSACYSVLDNSNVMKLPVGTIADKSVAKFSLSFFTDAACTVAEKSSFFNLGLINPPTHSTDQSLLIDISNVTTLVVNPSAPQLSYFAINSGAAQSPSLSMTLNFTGLPGEITGICASEVNDPSSCTTFVQDLASHSLVASGGAFDTRTFYVWGENASHDIFFLGTDSIDYVDMPTLSAPSSGILSSSLSWTSASGATTHDILYGTSPGNYTTTLLNQTSPHTISGLAFGTTYYFKIKANYTSISSLSSEMSGIVLPAPPLTPSSFNATGGQNNVQLNWIASSGLGTITYDVLRSTTPGSGYSPVNGCSTISGTVCSDTSISTDLIYYYIVRATNQGGTGPDSGEATGHAKSPPNILSLISPATSINNVATPTIYVQGVVTGDTVSLFSDIGCTNQRASGVASGTSISLTTSTLTDGSYVFYAKRTDATGISSCSSASVAYVLDTVAPTVAVSSVSAAIVNSPFSTTITFSKPIPSFISGNITVTNGIVTSFTTGDNTVYTATITPSNQGAVTVAVASAMTNDAAGNNNTVSNTLSRTYDSIVPTIINVTSSSADATYNESQTVSIEVTFSETVIYTGSNLSLSLNSGGMATYVSGSGTSTLTFNYTVAPGEFSTDLDYTSTSSLALTGIFTDIAGNNANLILPTVGTGGSLGLNKNIVINAPLHLLVDKAFPTNGANWNDYVQLGSDVPCSGLETGYYGEGAGCAHAGEKLKVIVTGFNTCANLTIADSLGAFDWICDSTSGTATFFSKGLKPKKGLRDLIAGTGGAGSWINNSVTVQLSASTIGLSNPVAWWTNPIAEAPATNPTSSTVTSLSTPGTIYYIHTSRQYYLLDITADKIAFVTLGSAVLSANNNTGGGAGVCNPTTGTSTGGTILSIVCLDAIKYMWLEGSFTGVTSGVGTVTWAANTGIKGHNIKYSRFNNISIDGLHRGTTSSAINLTSSSYNLITEMEIHAASAGVYLDASTYNIVRGLRAGDIGSSVAAGIMLNLTGTASNNRFNNLTLMDATNSTTFAQGISVAGSNNIFKHVMISNIGGQASDSAGVKLTGIGNIFVQLGTFSSNNTGMNIVGASDSIISHVTAANHIWNGIYFSGTNTNNYFQSITIANTSVGVGTDASTGSTGNIFRDIASSNNSTYGFDINAVFGGSHLGYVVSAGNSSGSCLGSGINFCSPTPIGSILTSAFVGKVTNNDISNTADTTGLASSISTLSGWLYFDNWLRGWGKDGTFPTTGTQGYATTSPYSIWDWRIKLGGSLHNNSLDAGASVDESAAFTNGTTCPVGVSGSQYATINSKTFLTHAIEIDSDDGTGNHNGLCESGEQCIYAPNIGAYQGEGALIGPCSFVDGTVTGVTMFSYSTTGI